MPEILRGLPEPYEFKVCFRRQPPTESEIFLQRRLKQVARGSVKTDAHADSFEEALLSTSMNGDALLFYEIVICLKRPTKELLRKALGQAASVLKKTG